MLRRPAAKAGRGCGPTAGGRPQSLLNAAEAARLARKRTGLEPALKQPLASGKAFASVACSTCPQRAIVMTIERIGAQIAEELFDLARQNFRRRGQLAGRREHRCRGLAGLADSVADRTN